MRVELAKAPPRGNVWQGLARTYSLPFASHTLLISAR